MATSQERQILIRRMTRSDIDGVLALDRKIGNGKTSISYRDMIVSDPGGALDLSFVAEAGEKMVGFLLAKLVYVYIPLSEICIIQAVVVDPEFQRQDIGSKLVNELLDQCQLEDIYTVRALVDNHDEKQRLFIERLGFRRSNIINYDKTFET
jgi:ribosomal protein S18 acetylase RimI-like enzyme